MKPEDVIQQFRQIRPLTNNSNINGFIKSIEIIMNFCDNNSELIKYGVRIIINEKIIAGFEELCFYMANQFKINKFVKRVEIVVYTI